MAHGSERSRSVRKAFTTSVANSAWNLKIRCNPYKNGFDIFYNAGAVRYSRNFPRLKTGLILLQGRPGAAEAPSSALRSWLAHMGDAIPETTTGGQK